MICRFLVFTILFLFILETVNCESGNFFVKVAKSVPRIGKRGTKGNAEFEKFFLKASKSVPRIGRRNENLFESQYDVDDDGYPQNKIKYPTWNELADRYEYEPELFSSPQLLRKLEEEVGDDPTLYDWDKVRLKRNARNPKRHIN